MKKVKKRNAEKMRDKRDKLSIGFLNDFHLEVRKTEYIFNLL